MAESTKTLSISIDLEIHQPGVNPRWRREDEIPLPPDYQEQDIAPFIRYQLERSVTLLEREHLGEARAADIIAAYDLRIRAIRALIRTAPHYFRTSMLAERILGVTEDDNETIFEQWHDRLED